MDDWGPATGTFSQLLLQHKSSRHPDIHLLLTHLMIVFFTPINPEFASARNMWAALSELAEALGFFSQSCLRHYYCYGEAEAESGTGEHGVERSLHKWQGEHISHLPQSDGKFPVLHF